MGTRTQEWLPVLERGGKPLYIEVADAIATDLSAGRLRPYDRLPPVRWLADQLAVNPGTIARAYTEAQRRGLIESRVGQGSFVRPCSPAAVPMGLGGDMSMNLPPDVTDPDLLRRIRAGFADLGRRDDILSLLRYQDFGGTAEDRQAAARWLSPRLPGMVPEAVIVCPGGQTALLAALSVLTRPGDHVCCEDLTYPGFRALVAYLGLTAVGLPMDDQGPDPEAFAQACRGRAPRALYLTPTLHNPTTVVVGEDRRHALIQVARQYAVPIIEDDAYGFLPRQSPPPFAALAPDLTFHVAGLSKCLGAGLRLAYLRAPDGLWQSKLLGALRAICVMASPVTAALATQWIVDGTALAILAAIRKECDARQRLLAAFLPPGGYISKPQAFHAWLPLPASWRRGEFLMQLRSLGVGAVASDAFAVRDDVPEAVRLCIGGSLSQAQLEEALRAVAGVLAHPRPLPAGVI